MLRVFIGYEPDETIALHVLSHSIWRHASVPVSITPLMLRQLPLTRERDPVQTSEFTFSRFIVPHLCNYESRALYLDCDMLVRCDIGEVFYAADADAQVSVVKHDYTPKHKTKFLGKTQTRYRRKNWSSLMMFNNANCKMLTHQAVNDRESSWLRKMEWADRIGELPSDFNHLVGEYAPNPAAKIVHFTLGTPCFAKYRHCEFAHEWFAEKAMMMAHNPLGEYSLPEKVSA